MKTAVISGVSRGFGKALVDVLLENDFLVFGCSRTYLDIPHKNFYFKECDLLNLNSINSFRDFVLERSSSIDVLINNASILGQRALIKDYDEKVWKEVIEINVNGTFYFTKAFLSFMNKNAILINVSSSVGRRPSKNWGAYAVSKWALEGFSFILKEENPDIFVFSFNPGAMRTKMRQEAYPFEDPNLLKTASQTAKALLKLIKYPDKFKNVQVSYEDL